MARLTKKKYAIIGGVSVVALTGGIAFAYWTSTGSDTDTATTGNENSWTVLINTASISNGTLTPGGATDNITFSVTNNDTGTKQIQGVVATVDSVVPGNALSTCDASDFSITGATVPTGVDVAGGGGSVNGSFNVQMINKTSANQDGCKGATVTYKVAVS